jgi:hypothetical protein
VAPRPGFRADKEREFAINELRNTVVDIPDDEVERLIERRRELWSLNGNTTEGEREEIRMIEVKLYVAEEMRREEKARVRRGGLTNDQILLRAGKVTRADRALQQETFS